MLFPLPPYRTEKENKYGEALGFFCSVQWKMSLTKSEEGDLKKVIRTL